MPVTSGFCRTRGPSAKRGGSYGLAPPLAYARGEGSPGQTASVRPAFQLEGVGRGRASNGFCRARGPSAKRGGSYGLAPPLAYARGGAARVRRQVFAPRSSCISSRSLRMVLGDVRSPACKPVLSESNVTAVGFEPKPLPTGAWSQRLRPLGQTVLLPQIREIADRWNQRPLG